MSIKVESITDTPENVAAANAPAVLAETEVETPENDQSETEEAVASDADAVETDEDDQDGEEEAEQETKPKKKSGYVRKLEKKDAELAAKDREIELLKQLAEKGKPKEEKVEPEKVTKSADSKPDPDKFDTYADYTVALTEWALEQKEAKKTQEATEKAQKEKAQEIGKKFNERLNSFKEKTEDFDDVVEAGIKAGHKLDDSAQHAIIESELSAQLMYELAKNLPELERISKLSPLQQIKELGKIEARLSAPPEKEVKKQSTAPAPIKPVQAKGATVTKSLSDPNLTQREYEAIRRKQQQAKMA